jgi:transcriptional regulator with XRE-family HTH domain
MTKIHDGVLGENIKRILAKKQITQKELACWAQVNETSLSRWMSGQHLPTIDNLYSVASALGVSMDELVDGWLTSED